MSATAFFFESEPGIPADYPLMQPAGFKRGWTFQRPNPSISSSSGHTTGSCAGQQRRRQYPRRPARLSEVAPLSPKSRLVRIALEDESHPCTPRTPLFYPQPDADGDADAEMKRNREEGEEVVMGQDEDEGEEEEDEEGDGSPVTGSPLSASFAMSNETRISSRSSMCPPGESTAHLKQERVSNGDCYAYKYNNDNYLEDEEDIDPLQNYEDDYGDEDINIYGDDYDEEADDFDFDDYSELEDNGGYYESNNNNNKYYQNESHAQDHGNMTSPDNGNSNDDGSQCRQFSECYSCGSPCEHPSTTTTPPPLGESQHYFIDVHDGSRRKAAYLFCWKCVAVFLSQMHQRLPHPGCGHFSSFGGSRGYRESASGSGSVSRSASSVSAGRRSQASKGARRSEIEGNGRRRKTGTTSAASAASAATGQEEHHHDDLMFCQRCRVEIAQ